MKCGRLNLMNQNSGRALKIEGENRLLPFHQQIRTRGTASMRMLLFLGTLVRRAKEDYIKDNLPAHDVLCCWPFHPTFTSNMR
jgi:hypothetical protein